MASRAKPGAVKLQEFDEHRVQEVADIAPSGNQDEHGAFSFNDLNQKAANLAIEAEVEASHEQLVSEAVDEPETLEITPNSPDEQDTGAPPGDGEATDDDGFTGEHDRRARPGAEPDIPPQASSAGDTLVVANDFAPEPGLDAVTGRQDMRHAARAYESVMATVGAHGMHPGDVLDSNL